MSFRAPLSHLRLPDGRPLEVQRSDAWLTAFADGRLPGLNGFFVTYPTGAGAGADGFQQFLIKNRALEPTSPFLVAFVCWRRPQAPMAWRLACNCHRAMRDRIGTLRCPPAENPTDPPPQPPSPPWVCEIRSLLLDALVTEDEDEDAALTLATIATAWALIP